MSEQIVGASPPKVQRVQIEGGGASDGAIVDGASSSIKATVKDYTNSNPLTVVTVDTNGDYVSGSGGTQYTEDAAAAANPVGTALIGVRADALAGVTTTDGDNVAARMTDKGELYVKHVDAVPVTDNGGNLSIDDGGNTITVDGTVAVTNAGLTELATAINSDKVDVHIKSSDVATGGTSAADDDDFTDGTTPGTPVMGVYESTPSTVTDGDLGVVGITDDRRLKTSAVISSGFVDITGGVIDVFSVVPGSSGNNLGKAEDAAHSTGHVGVMSLGVRDDTLGAFSDTEGDYEPFHMTAAGRLYTSATIDAALPAGANAIGKLAANSGVDIGDVDITSIAAGDNNIGNVDVASSALPTGASTLAEQQSQTTHLATIAGDTTDIEAAVEIIDDVIYADDADWTDNTSKHALVGGVYQSAPHTVTDGDVTPFLSDVNGRLAVSVGNTVTVTATNLDVQSGGTDLATSAQGAAIQTAVELLDNTVAVLGTATYTEATSSGLVMGAVRRDADTTLVNTTNEISPLQVDANGRLKVEAFSGEALPVTFTGSTDVATQTTLASLLTSSQLIDDTIATLGTTTYSEATTKGTTIGAVRRDADTTLVDTTNEIGPLQMDANGRLKVEAFSGETLPVSNTVLSVVGSGTEATAQRVTIATDSTGVLSVDDNGSTISIDDGAGAITVDNGGTFAVQATVAAAATSIAKAEDAAHTTGETGDYILGVRNDTPNTALTNTDADYASLTTDRVGGIRTALYETDFAVLGTNHVKKYYTSAGAATDGIVWSPAAGKRWYVTDIFINVSAAATVTLEDDLAGGDSPVWKSELAANSGWSHSFQTPLFSGEDAADLLITTTAGNVYVTVTGYEI